MNRRWTEIGGGLETLPLRRLLLAIAPLRTSVDAAFDFRVVTMIALSVFAALALRVWLQHRHR